MSEIIKFTGLVLKKVDFSETSKIATFFTPRMGKVTGIIKGGRTSKNKVGIVVDLLNETEIIIYSKESREVQLVSQANLVNHFHKLKEKLDSLKYASAIVELLDYFVVENENYERLYKGTIKILELMNRGGDPLVLFVKYLIFFQEEVGFGLNLYECAICGKELSQGGKGFNFEHGFICGECKNHNPVSVNLSAELFDDLVCLSAKDKQKSYRIENLNKLVGLLERNLMFHAPNFSGIKSLKVFN